MILARLRTLACLPLLSVLGCSTQIDARPGRSACETCHRIIRSGGIELGIETAHGGFAVECSSCHGGDPAATDKFAAHGIAVSGDLRGRTAVGLTQAKAAELRFANPADLRVARVGCGVGPAGDCHDEIISSVERSLSATFAGALTRPRSRLDEPLPVGVVLAFDGAPELAAGATPEVELFPHPLDVGSSDQDLLDLYLRKACARCHVYDFGTNRIEGDSRGSGCAACHVHYSPDGASATDDRAFRPDPPAPERHEIGRTPAEAECVRCHVGGARIGFAYRGRVPVEALGYLEAGPMQEVTDSFDPDVHAQAGMTCTDCHPGGELHGSLSLYPSRHSSPGILCQDCHGTAEAAIEPDGSGQYRAAAGWVLSRLQPGAEGSPELVTEDGSVHAVTQLASAADSRDAHSAAHDRVACSSCHSTFTIQCVGCHVTIDEREDSDAVATASLIDGLWQLGGAVVEEGFEVDTSLYQIGEAPDGTVRPVVSAQTMLVSHIDAAGETVRDRAILRRPDGQPVRGLAAVEPHTVGPARPCETCHVSADGSNLDSVRRIVGAAPTSAVVVDGEGQEWDVGRLLDDALEPVAPHPDGAARPLGAERARKLLEEPVR